MRTLTTLAVALAILSAHYWPAWADGSSYDGSTAQWFSSLKQPGTGFGCCSAVDCRAVPARFEDGGWISGTANGKPGETVRIPDEIIIRDKVSPITRDGEGMAILCESEYRHAYSVTVTGSMGTELHLFCFVIPPNFS